MRYWQRSQREMLERHVLKWGMAVYHGIPIHHAISLENDDQPPNFNAPYSQTNPCGKLWDEWNV